MSIGVWFFFSDLGEQKLYLSLTGLDLLFNFNGGTLGGFYSAMMCINIIQVLCVDGNSIWVSLVSACISEYL